MANGENSNLCEHPDCDRPGHASFNPWGFYCAKHRGRTALTPVAPRPERAAEVQPQPETVTLWTRLTQAPPPPAPKPAPKPPAPPPPKPTPPRPSPPPVAQRPRGRPACPSRPLVTCRAPGCTYQEAYGRAGLCHAHYAAMERAGHKPSSRTDQATVDQYLTGVVPRRTGIHDQCIYPGCDAGREAHHAKGMCKPHAMRVRRCMKKIGLTLGDATPEMIAEIAVRPRDVARAHRKSAQEWSVYRKTDKSEVWRFVYAGAEHGARNEYNRLSARLQSGVLELRCDGAVVESVTPMTRRGAA